MKILDQNDIPSARQFNDMVDALQAMRFPILGGGSGGVSTYNVITWNAAWHWTAADYACDTNTGGFRVLRGRTYKRGADYGLLATAYSRASALRATHGVWNVTTGPHDGTAKYDWIKGPFYLFNGSPLYPFTLNDIDVLHCEICGDHNGGSNFGADQTRARIVGDKHLIEAGNATYYAPAGATIPDDGNSYVTWSDPSGLTCVGPDQVVHEWYDYAGWGPGWRVIVNEDEFITNRLGYGIELSGALVNGIQTTAWGGCINFWSCGVATPRWLATYDKDAELPRVLMEVKLTGLQQLDYRVYPGVSYGKDGPDPIITTTVPLSWILVGHRIATDEEHGTGWPCEIVEPCGASIPGGNVIAGEWCVIDATGIYEIMRQPSPYYAYSLMPTMCESLVDMTSDFTSTLKAMTGQWLVGDGPVDEDLWKSPGFARQTYYRNENNTTTPWFDDSGDRVDFSAQNWYELYWENLQIGRVIPDIRLGDRSLYAAPPYGNLPRMD